MILGKKSFNKDGKMPKDISMMIGKNLHWMLVLGGGAILGAVIGILPDDAEATRSPVTALELPDESGNTLAPLELPPPSSSRTEATPEQPAPPGKWRVATVKPGDNLSLLFDRNNLSPQELYKVTSNKTAVDRLKKIYPGEAVKLRIDGSTLTELSYEFDLGTSLHMTRLGDTFSAEIIKKPLEHRSAQARGIINDSLFLSAQAAGLTNNLTMELAGIFGWDVDFALDIRQGDSFSVIYDEVFLDGEKVRDGDIIAASFTNQGKTYEAIRYTDPDGHTDYYSPDGRSMRKQFLRTPVEFTRISSRFSLGRKHPILNRIRAHKGVDYAAPTGTPIKAAGDGKVIYRGRKGGYGNVVVLQHGSTYSTLYGHMSRFARGIHSGRHVRQGQIIGYVGMTGLATGPHLHYEFRINGVHRNPLTVKLPEAKPLPRKYMADFKLQANRMIASLDLLNKTNVALVSQ
jgi:murein DD-endopeptidase MepM/ murein hydrolase activator NlpD